jgi:hypothetical protein
MKTLDLSNFGKFTIHGKGTLRPMSNDGRYKFYSSEAEALEALEALEVADFTLRRLVDDGWRFNVFVIQEKNCALGGEYGFYWGKNLEEALEDYFRILSENGYVIEEE